MWRKGLVFVFLFAFGFRAGAEEIILKDGTKIVGKVTSVKDDIFEVETSYGKMQVKRSDIVTITFTENKSDAASPANSEKKEPVRVEESMRGTQYVNKTADFSLSLPDEWRINAELRGSTDGVAALSSTDNMRYLLVVKEEYTASLDSYKGLVEIQAKKNLQDYEKVSDQTVTIDGKASALLSYKGTSAKAENLPIHFLVAIIPTGQGFLRITTWCVEPLFEESQAMFEKIIRSYHSPVAAATAATFVSQGSAPSEEA